MTEAVDPQNPSPEAPQSPVEPTAPDAPPTPSVASEPAPEPVKPAPEGVEGETGATGLAGDQELKFDSAEIEFAPRAEDHPSKQPVASRPAPAGPSSNPHERVARARDENR